MKSKDFEIHTPFLGVGDPLAMHTYKSYTYLHIALGATECILYNRDQERLQMYHYHLLAVTMQQLVWENNETLTCS